jgi:hypothetical protein
MLAIIILVAGVLTRFTDHAPNFTPTIALALFGGLYLPRKYALIVPLAFMMISDVFLGYHHTMPFTWGSVLLISLLGLQMRERKNFPLMIGMSIVSAVLFFIITNFGAWFDLYPRTTAGLLECYAAAIPFFRNSFVSAVVYSVVFFGVYELVAGRVKNTAWARVLLAS